MAGKNDSTWENQAMEGNNFKSITILMFIAAGALAFFILFMVSIAGEKYFLKSILSL